jgi:hypothetical protein
MHILIGFAQLYKYWSDLTCYYLLHRLGDIYRDIFYERPNIWMMPLVQFTIIG